MVVPFAAIKPSFYRFNFSSGALELRIAGYYSP
jgi:hypothetical protein